MKIYVVDHICTVNEDLNRFHTIVGTDMEEIKKRIIEDFVKEYNQYNRAIYLTEEECLEDGGELDCDYIATRLFTEPFEEDENVLIVSDTIGRDIDDGGTLYKIYEYEV